MQTKMNNKEIVLDAIQRGLKAFAEMAYSKVQTGCWYKKLKRSEQLQIGRAIFALRDIALAPDAHFARAATEDAWRARARAYAQSHGTAEPWAYYIIPSPADIVSNNVALAFGRDAELRARFNRFCDVVKDWHYNSTSRDLSNQATADQNAEKIIEMSKDICKDFEKARHGRAIYYINKVMENKTMQRMFLGAPQKSR